MRRSFTLPNIPAASQRTLTCTFDFSDLVKHTVVFAKASQDGQTDSYRFIETCRCEGELARKFTVGSIKTLQVAGAGGGARALRFVQSCARTRLNEAQCACVAELGPGVD